MQNERLDAQLAAAPELLRQRRNGAPEDLFPRGGQVDQVGGVGEDRREGRAQQPKAFDLRIPQRRGGPAQLVLGEDLNGPAADGEASLQGKVHTAGYGHVGSQKQGEPPPVRQAGRIIEQALPFRYSGGDERRPAARIA
jgi:hypothetical protein